MIKILSAAALGCMLANAPSAAQEASVVVGYGDLDLTSPLGVARLDSRIDRALDSVCDVRSQADLRHLMATRKCRNDAATAISLTRGEALAAAARGERRSRIALRVR